MDMAMCRACLSTVSDLVPWDETFVSNYNILTNLNVALQDGLSQGLCNNCTQTVGHFIEFREKCHISETTMRELIYLETKSENTIDQGGIELLPCTDIKQELKIEETDMDTDFQYESDNKTEIQYLMPRNDIDLNKESLEIMFKKNRSQNKKKTQSGRKRKLVLPKETKLKKKKTVKKILTISFENKNTSKHMKKIEKDKSKFILPLAKSKELIYYCGLCEKVLAEKELLKSHLESHKNDHTCGICGTILSGWNHGLGHRICHIPVKYRHCHLCNVSFRSDFKLQFHYSNEHFGDKTGVPCAECGKKYTTPRKLQRHVWSRHGVNKYFCDYCSKGFSSKSKLRSHISIHNDNKTFKCDQCDFSCRFNGGLKNHIIRRHSATKIYCKMCKLPFGSEEKYAQHKCTPIRMRMCSQCGRQFRGTNQLTKHMLSHDSARPYECARCPAKFKGKTALAVHLQRHDGRRTQHCEFCRASFYYASVLIKHRRTHTGEKPYVCKTCGKGFTGNNNLKVHMRVHGEYLVVKKNKDATNV